MSVEVTEQVKYRLVTRSDFDGLVCAVLLKHLHMIDGITFVHPKDMQDGRVAITGNDITTNLPYAPGCHLAFDHHASETLRHTTPEQNHIIDPQAMSAARVVYNYFGGPESFPAAWHDMMAAVDKADAAQFTQAEILHPTGWVLLNFIMDPRTGLGRFRNFRISNYNLMMQLIDACMHHTIDDIMRMPDVLERVDLYQHYHHDFMQQLTRCATMHKNVVVLDLLSEETIYPGNRFMIYAMFPQCNLSIHKLWGLKKQNTVFAVGKSILNRTASINIGELMLKCGGGGHANAGTCQIDNAQADHVLHMLLDALTSAAHGCCPPAEG